MTPLGGHRFVAIHKPYSHPRAVGSRPIVTVASFECVIGISRIILCVNRLRFLLQRLAFALFECNVPNLKIDLNAERHPVTGMPFNMIYEIRIKRFQLQHQLLSA